MYAHLSKGRFGEAGFGYYHWTRGCLHWRTGRAGIRMSKDGLGRWVVAWGRQLVKPTKWNGLEGGEG
jgi:hypothetical protein